MRVVSLLILLAILGAGAFAFVKRDLFFNYAKGFTAAKNPAQAMVKFNEAIKDRNYRAAAQYVSKEYADELEISHAPLRDMTSMLDKVSNLAKEKGLDTDKTATILALLDPFPTNFTAGEPKDVKGKFLGRFLVENNPRVQPQFIPANAQFDRVFLSNPFAYPIALIAIEIQGEGAGDAKTWKMNIPITPANKLAMARYREKAPSYVDILDHLRQNLTRSGAYSSKEDFESELLNKISGNAK